jgi:pyrimidine/purine-5'-nucleotide nucleosidase
MDDTRTSGTEAAKPGYERPAGRLPTTAGTIGHMEYQVIDTQVAPTGRLEVLSRTEAAKLLDSGHGSLHELYRNCSLAVLNSGNELDNAKELLERYQDFDIRIIQRPRGIKLDIKAAPASAFVDGKLIAGIQEHLLVVLRDVIYVSEEIRGNPRFALDTQEGITEAVFHILRNASILKPRTDPNVVVCWGGHSIGREEYDYTKLVGYQLGLRGFDICTGCGPGAMKGPMKGATIGHAKQRIARGRYLGFTEPGIIAGEAPNPIVNELVILPDVEKRLEAFVRTGHGFIVFPGGVGTAEEILYVLGVLLNPKNADMPFPLIFTGPKSAEAYFRQIDAFIGATLGPEAQRRYKIIIDDPVQVAQEIQTGVKLVRTFRKQRRDAYYFNTLLRIEPDLQRPFHPTHENMRKLKLHRHQPRHSLAANLRRAFSGVVAGNIKNEGIRAIEKHGKFEIVGDAEIMAELDKLLKAFVDQKRMKISGKYEPCYRIVVEPEA